MIIQGMVATKSTYVPCRCGVRLALSPQGFMSAVMYSRNHDLYVKG